VRTYANQPQDWPLDGQGIPRDPTATPAGCNFNKMKLKKVRWGRENIMHKEWKNKKMGGRPDGRIRRA